MKKKTVKITIMCVLVLSTGLFSAGVDLTGIGARATALGGNYRAIAQGWSAMFWNPAGLAFHEGWHAGFSTELIKVTAALAPGNSLIGQKFSATATGETENEPKSYLVPSGGIFYSTGKFAFGLGFWAPFGLGAQWDLLKTDNYNPSYPKFDFDDDLKIIDVHPTVAYKINDKLSIGVGASIIMADIMIQKPMFTPNPYIFSEDIKNNPIVTNLLKDMPASAYGPPCDHLLTDTMLKGDGMGVGANFGLLFKPSESFSIGLSARYYNTIPLEGTVDATMYFVDDADAQALVTNLDTIYKILLTQGKIAQDEYLVLSQFYSGSQYPVAEQKKVKADMPLPLTVGAGIAYTGINNLLISADFAMTQWSTWDVIAINDENGGKFSELVEKWDDSIRFGVGLEYSISSLKLRGSFYNESNAAIPGTMSPTIPDINPRNTFNVGLEIPVGPFNVHVSYEKMIVKDLNVNEWILSPDGLDYNNIAGSYSMSINNFMAGFNVAF